MQGLAYGRYIFVLAVTRGGDQGQTVCAVFVHRASVHDPGAGLKAASRIFFLLGVAGSLSEMRGLRRCSREEEVR
jgi:hypothetical protein